MNSIPFSVLIADDEFAIRNGLREIIPWGEYNAVVVDAVADGLSALASIRRNRPDLVVIDIKMPGMDGLEVIRQAREEGILSRFLILSGYDDFNLAQKAIRYGVKAYFLKPLRLQEFEDELRSQITELMAERNMRGNDAVMTSILKTSRLFLLNQLIANDLHSQEDLTRRAGMLGLQLDPGSPCLCAVVMPLSPGRETDETVHARIAAVLTQEMNGHRCEIWSRNGLCVTLCQQEEGEVFDPTPLRRLIQRLREEDGLRCCAGIGSRVSSPLHAAESFSQAMRAAAYELYQLPGDVYDASIICAQMPPGVATDGGVYDRMLEAIETHSMDDLSEQIGAFMDRLFFVPMPPPDYVRGSCTSLLHGVCERMNNRHPSQPRLTPPPAEAAKQHHAVAELRAWLMATLTQYADMYQQARRMTDPIIEAAKEYIHQHLSENVKASDVAVCVNLSASYFTTYFKQKTGCNFRDYVLQEKMRYASELLRRQEMNVSQIAYAMGYTDYRSFSRAFKNVTNHAPSDYQHTEKKKT
ncbi:MAG: response regulator [Aristaeellaceae bacterium]